MPKKSNDIEDDSGLSNVGPHADTQKKWMVKIYVQHGYFQYPVSSVEKAIAHGEAIMKNQVYRRVTQDDSVEFHHAYKVKVTGPDLGTEYPDEFCRT